MAGARIRRIRADDGPLLREIRLRALADSPSAFASTLDEERDLGAAEWTARAAAAATGAEQVVVLATIGEGSALGMAGGRVREEPGVISLWGMWVDPAARGEHVGRRLVDAVADWARSLEAHTFRLGVMDDAPQAVRFYERIGFLRLDGARPLARDPSRTWHVMVRPL